MTIETSVVVPHNMRDYRIQAFRDSFIGSIAKFHVEVHKPLEDRPGFWVTVLVLEGVSLRAWCRFMEEYGIKAVLDAAECLGMSLQE